MAVLTSSSPNIADLMKELDPQGRLAKAAVLMTQAGQIVPMLPAVKANNKTHHRITQIVSLPQTTERALNEGTLATKHEAAQHDEGIALLDQWAIADCKLAELSGNVAAYRAQRVRTGTISIGQRVEYLTFKGNQATSAKQFTGVQWRYNTLSDANVAQQIVNQGGDANLTSMYLIRAGLDSVYYVYPDGSQGGLQHIDYGRVVEQNQGGVTGAHMASYQDQISWDVGLAVADQRCVVRIANIETDDFTSLDELQSPTTFTNIIHKMMIAWQRLPKDVMGDDFFACNRTVLTGLWRLAMEKSVTALGLVEGINALGQKTTVPALMGVPILLADQLTNDETAVS